MALASTPLSTSKPYFISTMLNEDDDDDGRASSTRLSTAGDGGGCGGRRADDADARAGDDAPASPPTSGDAGKGRGVRTAETAGVLAMAMPRGADAGGCAAALSGDRGCCCCCSTSGARLLPLATQVVT